jgi:hypothetical protein
MRRNIDNCTEEEALKFAADLVRHGVRTPTIALATGLSQPRIRELYRYIYGTIPPTGRFSTPANYANTWSQLAQISIYVDIYYGLFGEKIYEKDLPCRILRRVCRARENYIVLYKQTNQHCQLLDANVAYDAAKAIIDGGIRIVRCSSSACRFPSLVIDGQHKPIACPLCQTPLKYSTETSRKNLSPGRPKKVIGL